ncbi:MAG: uncharacterized protein JWM28_3527 [Chitinophagaceae bacterium]|nr:uncharacterized protein [Chitinophagaceae bacterium]
MSSSYWITKPDHKISLDRSIGNIQLGLGIDLTNPDDPILRNVIPFEQTDGSLAVTNRNQPIDHNSITESSQVIEAMSEYEEARMLSAYFRGSFGLTSFSAALNTAGTRRQYERAVYVILESQGDDDTLIVPSLTWSNPPNSETIASFDERRMQFIQTYGSHYVSSIKYSFRIALRGAIQSVDETQRLAFSAAFSGWGVSAGADLQNSQRLRQMNVHFTAEVFASSIEPQTYANRWIMTSFDDINDFLLNLRNGVITIKRAPIQASLSSFWPTLLNYPSTRSVLQRNTAPQLTELYGVPRGTILPWIPTEDNIIETPDPTTGQLMRTISLPNGWEICTGVNNTPLLDKQFLRGGISLSDIGLRGGNESHSHSGATANAFNHSDGYKIDGDRGSPQASGLSHYHDFSTNAVSHLPPYSTVIYIIKI